MNTEYQTCNTESSVIKAEASNKVQNTAKDKSTQRIIVSLHHHKAPVSHYNGTIKAAQYCCTIKLTWNIFSFFTCTLLFYSCLFEPVIIISFFLLNRPILDVRFRLSVIHEDLTFSGEKKKQDDVHSGHWMNETLAWCSSVSNICKNVFHACHKPHTTLIVSWKVRVITVWRSYAQIQIRHYSNFGQWACQRPKEKCKSTTPPCLKTRIHSYRTTCTALRVL